MNEFLLLSDINEWAKLAVTYSTAEKRQIVC